MSSAVTGKQRPCSRASALKEASCWRGTNIWKTIYCGLTAYGLATFKVLFDGYIKADLRVSMDQKEVTTSNSLTAVITKLPYYGYGFKVVPQAQFDDGYLHLLILNAGPIGTLYALATSLMGGNRMGEYYKAKEIDITTSTEQLLQRNGDPEKEKRTHFSFKVLPKELKLIF